MSKLKTPLYKKIHHKLSVYKRMVNSGNRSLPNFLIIGAAKSGTTSLFQYLMQHPNIYAPFKKEIHFFDKHYNKGVKWYQLHFPTTKELESANTKGITGEATPYYLSHPLVPERTRSLLPDVKLIVLLRNPVERAFSNYNHMVRTGFEGETFERAIELESVRTEGEFSKMLNKDYSYSFKHHHYSYLSRSIYHIEISRWLQYFKKDDFIFLNSDDLYSNTAETYQNVLSFLGLEPYKDVHFSKLNSGGDYSMINEKTKSKLNDFFKPHNEKLFRLIEQQFNW